MRVCVLHEKYHQKDETKEFNSNIMTYIVFALQNEGGLSKGVLKNREEIEKTGQRQLEIKNELKILDIETRINTTKNEISNPKK